MKPIINETTMQVDDFSVKIMRKQVKHLHLKIHPPEGQVSITVPVMLDDESVRLAVIGRLDWIKQKIKRFVNQPKQSAKEFITGESHDYLGKSYLLKVSYTAHKPYVELKDNQLILRIKRQTNQELRERLLTEWYRQEMKKLVPGIIQKWETISGLKVGTYGIKRMKTRWGSCNPRHKRIWLNLELIKKPMHCLEYVVVHEIVHFLEPNHGHKFKAHMDRLMPQWREHKAELNRVNFSR